MPSNQKRLFIAVEIPSGIQETVHNLHPSLRHLNLPFRLVAPENLHFTLKFLGETQSTKIPAIQTVLSTIDFPSFTSTLIGLGVFPSLTRPSVLWVGIQDATSIRYFQQLSNQLQEALHPLGFPLESRKFQPHLTIARIKHPPRSGSSELERLSSYIDQHQTLDFGIFSVSAIHLKQSTLTPQGPIYTTLFTKDLLTS